MIHIAKNKQKKPWNKAHEFKRKKSTRRQVGHPSYIYAKRGRNVKYLTFTHTPENKTDYVKLKHNIDPEEKGSPTYMNTKYSISILGAFDPPDKKYRIHKDDKATIKKYQK